MADLSDGLAYQFLCRTRNHRKRVFIILLLFPAALLCGCPAVSPQDQPAPVAGTPDRVGNWSGTMVGYEKGTGCTDYSGAMMCMNMTGQRDRIFSCALSFGLPWDGDSPEEFAGVIGRDGRTLTIVEQEGEYSSGIVVSENEVELVYAKSGGNFSVAIDTIRRVSEGPKRLDGRKHIFSLFSGSPGRTEQSHRERGVLRR